jgi:hypothetical protein
MNTYYTIVLLVWALGALATGCSPARTSSGLVCISVKPSDSQPYVYDEFRLQVRIANASKNPIEIGVPDLLPSATLAVRLSKHPAPFSLDRTGQIRQLPVGFLTEADTHWITLYPNESTTRECNVTVPWTSVWGSEINLLHIPPAGKSELQTWYLNAAVSLRERAKDGSVHNFWVTQESPPIVTLRVAEPKSEASTTKAP